MPESTTRCVTCCFLLTGERPVARKGRTGRCTTRGGTRLRSCDGTLYCGDASAEIVCNRSGDRYERHGRGADVAAPCAGEARRGHDAGGGGAGVSRRAGNRRHHRTTLL